MFLGTRKDYYFHYSAGDLAHCFVSMHSAAIETDVCSDQSRRQILLMAQSQSRSATVGELVGVFVGPLFVELTKGFQFAHKCVAMFAEIRVEREQRE